jgi:hypothetical protein
MLLDLTFEEQHKVQSCLYPIFSKPHSLSTPFLGRRSTTIYRRKPKYRFLRVITITNFCSFYSSFFFGKENESVKRSSLGTLGRLHNTSSLRLMGCVISSFHDTFSTSLVGKHEMQGRSWMFSEGKSRILLQITMAWIYRKKWSNMSTCPCA